MGVGYALGNKNKKQADEEEILVLGEDDQALRKLIEVVRDMNKHPESSKIEQHKE